MTGRLQVVSAPKRPSGVVVPQRPKWHGEIAACAVSLLGRTLAATWRVEVKNESGRVNGPLIVAVWHNRLALAMPIWKWWNKDRPSERLAALISASRDGALLARIFSYFGVIPIRGSSSRRGAQALLELNSALKSGLNVAITPDGPRGPKYKVQSGVISLAQLSGVPIVPVGVKIARKKQLRSWDAFQIPFPFSRCQAAFGTPITVPRDASPERREQARLQLETALLSMNGD